MADERPADAKAADDAGQPGEDNIQQIVDMGFTRDEAQYALKAHNNDLSRAIEYILTGPGDLGTIQDVIPSRYASAVTPPPPQRPASRVGQSGFEPADTQFFEQRPDQESGEIVDSAANTQFGPATKELYDAAQWSVVPYAADDESSHNSDVAMPTYVDDGAVRFREAHVPPVLVPSKDALGIAALLVILHAIPRARKALLSGGHDLLPDYGFHPMWSEIAIIDLERAFREQYGNSTLQLHSRERSLVECQRFMAFLDGESLRPYAVTDVIAAAAPISSLLAFKGDDERETPLGRYLQDFVELWDRNSEATNTFETAVVAPPPDGSVKHFLHWMVDVTVALNHTLYDLIDDMLWLDEYTLQPRDQEADETETPHAYFEKVGEVISIGLKRDDRVSGAGISLPLVWYPDRYTKPVATYVYQLRQRRVPMQKKLAELTRQKTAPLQHGRDVMRLLTTTVSHMEDLSRSDLPDNEKADVLSALEELHAVELAVEQERADVVKQIAEIQQVLAAENDWFKGPDSPGYEKVFPDIGVPEFRPYHLCGLIISPTEYCFRQAPAEDVDLIDLDDSPASAETKWWKVVFQLRSNVPVISEISENAAVEWAQQGSSKHYWQEVTAIYASEDALDAKKHFCVLPDGLKRFMTFDKRHMATQVRSVPRESYDSFSDDAASVLTSPELSSSTGSLSAGHDDVEMTSISDFEKGESPPTLS